MLLSGNLRERLGAIADLLFSMREEAMQKGLDTSAASNPEMAKIMDEIARQKLACSFQTTVVALRFRVQGDALLVKGVCCGDSAFFAFSPNGELLSSSLGSEHTGRSPSSKRCPRHLRPGLDGVEFGPGDELLARVLFHGADRPDLLSAAGIESRAPINWLICSPLDVHSSVKARAASAPQGFYLTRSDMLLVPRYLARFPDDPVERRYCRLRFSRAVRKLPEPSLSDRPLVFSAHGSTTFVLPDHYHTGNWMQVSERHEQETHFVLASDGFYGCFDDSTELWAWLQAHAEQLREPTARDEAALSLHQKLAARTSDDDISFIWVVPTDLRSSNHAR